MYSDSMRNTFQLHAVSERCKIGPQSGGVARRRNVRVETIKLAIACNTPNSLERVDIRAVDLRSDNHIESFN